jgi:hypothetical protein
MKGVSVLYNTLAEIRQRVDGVLLSSEDHQTKLRHALFALTYVRKLMKNSPAAQDLSTIEGYYSYLQDVLITGKITPFENDLTPPEHTSPAKPLPVPPGPTTPEQRIALATKGWHFVEQFSIHHTFQREGDQEGDGITVPKFGESWIKGYYRTQDVKEFLAVIEGNSAPTTLYHKALEIQRLASELFAQAEASTNANDYLVFSSFYDTLTTKVDRLVEWTEGSKDPI